MNYLVCNHCNHKNAVYTPHLVFCNQCQKKIKNNFTDWKKSNNGALFENYISLETTTDASPINIERPIKLGWYKKSQLYFEQKANRDVKVIIGVVAFQLVLFAFLMKLQNNSLALSNKETSNDFQSSANWRTRSITKDISVSVPYNLIKVPTTLSLFMQDHITKSNSLRAEMAGSFSITVESFEMNRDYPIPHDMLYQVKDEYMQLAQFEYPDSDKIEHIKTKQYQTTVRYGEYTLNSKQFLYENYTLIKGYSVVNVTLSYLKDEDVLYDYASEISESLLKNKTI